MNGSKLFAATIITVGGALLLKGLFKKEPITAEQWAGITPNDHNRRLTLAAMWGIEYRPPTWYNPTTGESMPSSAFANVTGYAGQGGAGTFQSEVDWINGQIAKGTPRRP